MQKLFFFFVFISLNVTAADRSIWDLMYLPNAGTISGSTQLTHHAGRAKYGSVRSDISGVGYFQTLGYSITDSILLTGSVNYLDLSNKINLASSKSYLRGWSDPTLEGRVRLLDQQFLVDILLGGTASTGDYEASANKTNNKGSNDFYFVSGPAFFLGVEAGQKLESLQYALLFKMTHMGETTDRNEGFPTVENEAHNLYLMQASLLNNLMEKTFLKSYVSARFVDAFSDDGTPDTKTAPITDLRIGSALQYAVTSDVLAHVGVNYRKLNYDSGTLDDFHIWMFDLGARYQF